MVSPPLPTELADLVERIARHPHGLGFLHQAYLESVAVTLGVHPFVVDAARAYLETVDGRAVLIEEVRRAHERMRTGSEGGGQGAARAATVASPTADCLAAKELVRQAEGDTRGVRFLVEGPPGEVAAAFQVHPYLVFRARGMLERHEECHE